MADTQSSFNDFIRRMQRDYKPIVQRKRLDFSGTVAICVLSIRLGQVDRLAADQPSALLDE